MELHSQSQANTQALANFVSLRETEVLPTAEWIRTAESRLCKELPSEGAGLEATSTHLHDDILPALNGSSVSPYYYGFVTGGVTPAAQIADNIVTVADQNAAAYFPDQTISAQVEETALELVLDLLDLSRDRFPGRTFTTGATASNVLGIACGRQAVFEKHAASEGNQEFEAQGGVANFGLLRSCRMLDIDDILVLTTAPHASLWKAASLEGIGRQQVKNLPLSTEQPWKFDLVALERELSRQRTLSIISVSCGEVKAGLFATKLEDMQELRRLCDTYGAWLHVDGAFGIFARTLPDTPEYSQLKAGVAGIELADSITADAHKLLNVPYDCGLFFCRSLSIMNRIFTNKPDKMDLSTMQYQQTPAPLNIGLENSRRFRALPVYATLISYGLNGYRDMLGRQISLARRLGEWISKHPSYELLPHGIATEEIFMIIMFQARDDELNKQLMAKINASKKMYVSGSLWEGSLVTRIAISNWKVDIEKDFKVVTDILESVLTS